jgi:hypothetical protein
MGQGKGNLGGKFSPWGHRLNLEAKAAPLSNPLTYLKGSGGLGVLLPTLAAGPTATLHFSLSRLRVGKALPQKFSTISTTPSCCWSNLSLHHTCWTKEGGDIAAPYVCIARRCRPLWRLDRIARRRWLVRLHHPRSVEHFCYVISSRVWRSHLSISLITSPRLNYGFLVRIRRNFFDLLCWETLQISWNNRFSVRGENILSRSNFSFKLKLIWYTTH